MDSIPQVAAAIHTILTTVAEAAGRHSGFVRRQSKLGGKEFVQTLTFGFLSKPDASYEDLVQTSAALGVTITAQGLEQRFTPQAVACLAEVVQAAIGQVICAEPVAIPLLQRFQGVYIQDSTTISLPDEMAARWPGCGGRPGEGLAAVKLQVRFDLNQGTLLGPWLQPGRSQDRAGVVQQLPLPAGALRLADLGYFSLAVLRDMTAHGVYWLSRVQAGTQLYDAAGHVWELDAYLAAQADDTVDATIQLGCQARLPCRLLATRVSPEMAAQRREQLHKEARERSQPVSRQRLRLADWNICVTNLLPEQLTPAEAWVLLRARWQIELLFKLWKSEGHLDQSSSQKPWRIMAEFYAKLLVMIIQHWICLTNCWALPDRSLVKAVRTLRRSALHLAFGCAKGLAALREALQDVQRTQQAGCRMNKRKKHPNTYQLLFDSS